MWISILTLECHFSWGFKMFKIGWAAWWEVHVTDADRFPSNLLSLCCHSVNLPVIVCACCRLQSIQGGFMQGHSRTAMYSPRPLSGHKVEPAPLLDCFQILVFAQPSDKCRQYFHIASSVWILCFLVSRSNITLRCLHRFYNKNLIYHRVQFTQTARSKPERQAYILVKRRKFLGTSPILPCHTHKWHLIKY